MKNDLQKERQIRFLPSQHNAPNIGLLESFLFAMCIKQQPCLKGKFCCQLQRVSSWSGEFGPSPDQVLGILLHVNWGNVTLKTQKHFFLKFQFNDSRVPSLPASRQSHSTAA